MSYLNLYYPESRFGGFTDVDGTITFYNRVHSFVTPESVVLDVGCGRGEYVDDTVKLRREQRIFKGKVKRVIGIDVDPVGQINPFLDEFGLIENGVWPMADASVDVCVSDWVMEHLDNPAQFFEESRRVLKPGGFLFLRTANANNYIGIISRLIPNRLHASVLNRAQEARKEQDVFPTRYCCNSKRKIRAMLDRYGFDHCVYEFESEPYYLSFSRPLYYLGVLHQRFALSAFRAAIFAFAQKRPTTNQLFANSAGDATTGVDDMDSPAPTR